MTTTEQATLCSDEDVAPSKPEGACYYYDECGNLARTGRERNEICGPCLYRLREAGRGHDK